MKPFRNINYVIELFLPDPHRRDYRADAARVRRPDFEAPNPENIVNHLKEFNVEPI